MIYQETIYNIFTVMQEMGKLRRDQLIRFFASELPPMQTKHLLDQLEINHALIYDEENDTYKFPGAPKLVPDLEKKMITAFWVLVKAGSKSVMQVMRGRFPTQIAFISSDNNMYDVTVITTEQDAKLAQKVRNDHIAANEVDITTHIGIIYRESDIRFLENYGFDICARVNPTTFDVTYTKLEV